MVIKIHTLAGRALPIVLLLALLLTAGCAPATKVILLPDPDGKVGVVNVSSKNGATTLQQAWQTTEVAGRGKTPSEPRLMDKKDVQAMFKEALAAEPIPPVSLMVFFKTESYGLTTEALQTLTLVLEEIRARQSTDIIVSGHTDTAGPVGLNKKLSLKRARIVADFIVSKGIKAENVLVTYHGKGNLLVPTPDGVAEPRNRRVEITVR